MPAAIAFAIQALSTLPSLIQAGVQVIQLIESTKAVLQTMQVEQRDPTQAEWEALEAQITATLAKLDNATRVET
jgi:hypothetical protein